MSPAQKTEQLAALIREGLTPLISSDYLLLDCPYHYNIGDSLIWQGERDFLSTLPVKSLGQSSIYTFQSRKRVDRATTILLHGGGNFGDVWREHTSFRLKIAKLYPDNPMVVLPQTVHYRSAETMKADAEAFSRHPRLTICARDAKSYAILKENFSNNILLLPDMAFCIKPETFSVVRGRDTKGVLFLKRRDRELPEAFAAAEAIPEGADVLDWPRANKWSGNGLIFWALRSSAIATDYLPRLSGLSHRLSKSATDRYAAEKFLPHAVRVGAEFVGSYREVYTTRLHGAIISLLLGKGFRMYDNNYGKNRNFFDSWLSDTDGAQMI